jgi:hypothetical protein
MAMDQWLDGLAKDSATTLSRRQAFGRLAGGFGMAVFALFGLRGLARDKDTCGKLCEECCRNQFPNGGRDFGQCVSACQKGEGLCGPIVCPQ